MLNKQNQATPELGLVISYFGNSVAVETQDGQVFQCHLHRNQALPVVGDRVHWHIEHGDTGIIEKIEPRRSLLYRGDHRGKTKPIAANVDAIFVVMAPAPVFSDYLVDRYLVAAELVNIDAMLVLNKTDLLSDDTKEKALSQLAPYQTIGYPVILSSVYHQDGLKDLGEKLKGKTVVLVGPSGVGKSSIIAAFCQRATIRVAEVSAKGAGKHTTTATRLYHLPQGGQVIDSPGVREFTLWTVNQADLLRGFKEFAPFENLCKFRDCRHVVEPGCAIQKAVAEGKISQQRYESYQTLMQQTKK